MTQMLASVTGVDEAALAIEAGVDIVDLKDPQRGALGALALPVIRETVAVHGGRRLLSATIGDLPPHPARVAGVARAIAAAGVDYVKVGLFGTAGEGAARRRTVEALGELAGEGISLVAVLMADAAPDVDLLPHLVRAGFIGVMIDTERKPTAESSVGRHGVGLRSVMQDEQLAEFVELAQGHGLLAGLAGSLAVADIAPLLSTGCDILGFRGALCDAGRDSPLCPERMADVRRAIAPHNTAQLGSPRHGSTASAGLHDAV